MNSMQRHQTMVEEQSQKLLEQLLADKDISTDDAFKVIKSCLQEQLDLCKKLADAVEGLLRRETVSFSEHETDKKEAQMALQTYYQELSRA